MSFDPTPEAKALFATLNKRWNDLFAWGVEAKLPSAKLQIADWTAYAAAWMSEHEEYAPPDLPSVRIKVLPGLGAQANQLASVEQAATTAGYNAKGPIPGAGIDVTETGEGTRAAEQVDEAAKAAAEAAAKAKAEAERAASSLWGSIPWYVKLGGAAVGVAIIVNAARR